MTTPAGAPMNFLEEVAASYAGDGCLIWPFARSAGYAHINIDKKHCLVTRILCERRHGMPPSPNHHAAHSCGGGARGCVNPQHLRWATRSENEQEKVEHGTSNRGTHNGHAKITEDDARKIKGIWAGRTSIEIARDLGVSRQAITNVKYGRTWAWL